MDNFEGGLADILRAGGSGAITTTTTTTTTPTTTTTNTTLDGDTPAEITDWQFQYSDPPNYPLDDFRDPFPLLHELNMPVSSSMMIGTGGFGSGVFSQISCHNIFSGDSPAMVASPRPSLKPPPTLVSNEHMMSNISVNSSKSLLVDSSTNGVQISSPRNTGIKRRKSQAKKVVCIPAPTPANSRATGEVVPSDLWAWRKYGQKPIKGSPYPRGYYRCSSSKGCSARKQVERSRTDPNMLVITYTSEHNHPWPVQRNVLAGSTRSQPTKNNPSKGQKEMIPNKEQNEITAPDKAQVSNPAMTRNSTTGPSMKEEMEESDKLSERFVQSYKPVLPEYNSKNNEDLFANLEEIEGESEFSLLFTQGFSGEDIENKEGLDPFSFYDWIGDNSNNTSFGEAKGSSQ